MLRDSKFVRRNRANLVVGAIKEALDKVEKVFVTNNLSHLLKSNQDKLGYKIKMTLEGRENLNPPEKHELAIMLYFL